MFTATELLIASRICKFDYLSLITLSNRRYNEKGEAVFMSAALGVVMNTDTGAQRFYGG